MDIYCKRSDARTIQGITFCCLNMGEALTGITAWPISIHPIDKRVQINLVEDLIISYCPWCGSLIKFYEYEKETTIEDKTDEINKNLFRPISELELSIRSFNYLKNANIKYIYELVQKTGREMLKTKYFGRKSLNEIKRILEDDMGLHLGMTRQELPDIFLMNKTEEERL